MGVDIGYPSSLPEHLLGTVVPSEDRTPGGPLPIEWRRLAQQLRPDSAQLRGKRGTNSSSGSIPDARQRLFAVSDLQQCRSQFGKAGGGSGFANKQHNYGRRPIPKPDRTDPQASVTGLDPQQGTSNYFIGNDPSQWHTGIVNYSQVEYQNIYAGINLVYYGNQQQLEYDYRLAPGADPSIIRFDIQGADSLSLDATGNLIVHTSTGNVHHGGAFQTSPGGNGDAFVAKFNLASPTTTTITSSNNPSLAGQTVTLTATVSGSGRIPTGTVSFMDGGALLGTGSLANPQSTGWNAQPQMIAAQYALATATGLNGVIYAIGGNFGDEYDNSVESYTPGDAAWSPVVSMPSARRIHRSSHRGKWRLYRCFHRGGLGLGPQGPIPARQPHTSAASYQCDTCSCQLHADCPEYHFFWKESVPW